MRITSSSVETWFKDYSIKPRGILHVGAHCGQEFEFYNSLGVNQVVWFEALPDIFEKLKTHIASQKNHRAINSLLYSKKDLTVDFYVSSNEKISSSMNKPLMHVAVFPAIKFDSVIQLKTNTLDNAIVENHININEFDCIFLDTQGSELEILKGFERNLSKIEIIVTEISVKKLYKKSVLFTQLKKYLEKNGFVLIASHIHQEIGDGNALFLRTNLAKNLNLTEGMINDVSGRKFVLGIFIRSILLHFLPVKIVFKFSRKITRNR